MTKIFLLLNQSELCEKTDELNKNSNYELMYSCGEFEDILTQINNFCPDIILIENNYENCEYVIRQIRSETKNLNTQIILLLNQNTNSDFINLADGLIECPIKNDVLVATINSHLKIKKSLDRLYENNKELSKSLYQLNVLYNTSSQFAGTLNTNKLYDIMIEAMEKTLSYDVASLFIYNPLGKSIFNLNTIHTPSDNLIQALKIRSILNYRITNNANAVFDENDVNDIETIQKIKQERSNRIYNIEAVSYDSLFAPIKVGEEFFGVIELFRQTPFTPEDVTCFQAITHQVALPLRSAKLYEDISVANKKLEKLERLKSEFVSIVSHELRTPLTPINNSLEIVLSEQAGPISDDAKNFISMAKRNIQRLSGIIEDLLDLSRIQTGKMDFKYKVADITPSLELLQKTFLQVAAEKNITINLNIDEKLPAIYADIRRIEQIFTNLVSNSLKFTPQDGKIDIKTKLINAKDIDSDKLILPKSKIEGTYIQISVQDNGIGMKKEDIPKIFDKFSQIESSLNRNKGGVGLGLTITKQLIDSHLGAIWVESEEHKGSSFNVILPLINDKNVFEMDLSKALINNDEIGAIKIILNNKMKDLIDNLKQQKLLNLTKLSKEIFIEADDIISYYAFIPKISFESFEAMFANLDEYCTKNKTDEYDIMLSKAHSKKNGIEAKNIIKILDN